MHVVAMVGKFLQCMNQKLFRTITHFLYFEALFDGFSSDRCGLVRLFNLNFSHFICFSLTTLQIIRIDMNKKYILSIFLCNVFSQIISLTFLLFFIFSFLLLSQKIFFDYHSRTFISRFSFCLFSTFNFQLLFSFTRQDEIHS